MARMSGGGSRPSPLAEGAPDRSIANAGAAGRAAPLTWEGGSRHAARTDRARAPAVATADADSIAPRPAHAVSRAIPPADRIPAPRVRIATWNVRKAVGLDWRRDPGRILAVLRETGAEIAILQEADRRLAPRLPALSPDGLADAGWRAVPTDPGTPSIGHHGNAILLREGWTAAHVRRIDLPGLEPRGALAATLEGPAGPLWVLGVHLGLRARDRLAQMGTLAGAAAEAGSRAILAGDLNEWRRDPGALPLPDAWTWHVPGPTFHAAAPVLRLDRIAAAEGIAVEHLRVHRSRLASLASDHLPVCATLIPREEGGPAPP